ncbi:Uncharacterized protein BM_BM9978 [Brugia malayi]|uniref:Bm9978 n=1 Tax=Brugia malayi TaxID=6279 RepID=A0A0K0K155_BRUMA|nr:Uncharacterized protein BM_BM9978 [Brugia malayi]CRZ24492.1 Bm9978 [Brugia malayi]VIO98401.1 Uncharacterized protein BM_BM9978 [Brugia malayi]
MGLFESKSTSARNHIGVKGKKSQQKEVKPLNVKQSINETGSYSKKDPVTDMKMKQIAFWISNQESKQNRDFMKISKSKLEKKKDESPAHGKQTRSTIMRRQRDKSLKEELSRRIEIINPTEMKAELKKHSLRDKVGTIKPKERITQNRNMDKNNDDNLERTQEQCPEI